MAHSSQHVVDHVDVGQRHGAGIRDVESEDNRIVSVDHGSDRLIGVLTVDELLEIDRLTLGNIAHKHPRVWSVVRSFY